MIRVGIGRIFRRRAIQNWAFSETVDCRCFVGSRCCHGGSSGSDNDGIRVLSRSVAVGREVPLEPTNSEKLEPKRSGGGLSAGPHISSKQLVESLASEDYESFPRLQKPFVDRIWSEVKAGNGGEPAPSAMRKQANAPQKGPGYGGHGGSVYLKCSHLIESFINVPQKINAQHGGNGENFSRGIHGKDFCLHVPLGTIVRQRVYSGQLTDEGRKMHLPQFRYQFLRPDDTYLVARGGIGGIGPISFRKRDSRKGTPGQRTRLELELRILNDCALVGQPNAGKTSLLAALSRAHTRIGPEEYSTVRPHVGVIRYRDRVEIRLCDLPGIKQGAHLDKDMGKRILRHTYRSRALAFVVDVARGERNAAETVEEVEMLREEAIKFDPLNAQKPWMVIGTKCDALHRDALYHLDSLHFRLRARHGLEIPIIGTSSRFGLGLERLVRAIRQLIYPDLLEANRRLPAERFVTQHPGVLHTPFTGYLPSLDSGWTPPLMLPQDDTSGPRSGLRDSTLRLPASGPTGPVLTE